MHKMLSPSQQGKGSLDYSTHDFDQSEQINFKSRLLSIVHLLKSLYLIELAWLQFELDGKPANPLTNCQGRRNRVSQGQPSP